jgi:hypothetical protein
MCCVVDNPRRRAVEEPVLEHDWPVGMELPWRARGGEDPEQPQDISVLRLGEMLLDAISIASNELCEVRVRTGVLPTNVSCQTRTFPETEDTGRVSYHEPGKEYSGECFTTHRDERQVTRETV